MRSKIQYGQRFGHLTAIADTGERISYSAIWLCKCDCGAFTKVSARSLVSGSTKTCGKCRFRGKDITGQKFGRLTALYPTGEKKKEAYVWHCSCDCGGETDVSISQLTSGKTKSCGCAREGICRRNIRGQVFGSLTAIEPLEKRISGNVVWRCRCACGNEVEVITNRLTQGGVTSCGCKSSNRNKPSDLTGQSFGKLTALYPTDKRIHHSIAWHCKCACGGEKDVSAVWLKAGRVKSCGCISRKKREE